MNNLELQDLMLEAEQEAQQIVEDVLAEFYKPEAETLAAIMFKVVPALMDGLKKKDPQGSADLERRLGNGIQTR
jgi:hypothetical protein